jgi:ribonuclease HI
MLDDVLQQVPDEDWRRCWSRFYSPLGVRKRYVIRLHFAASNNIAEYEALVNGLYIATELGIWCFDVRGDS